jgi:hypothetical protein
VTDASKTYGVTNTVWSKTAGTTYASATSLTSTSIDTLIPVAASSSNNVYFGLGVPLYQAPQNYNGIIYIQNNC